MKTTNAEEHRKFIRCAYANARESRDLSTQNGAVLVNSDGGIIGRACNRFALGVAETEERLNNRELKYPRVCHAEEGSLWDAVRKSNGVYLPDATLYVAWYACEHCAVAIIESGVRRVIGHLQHPGVHHQHSKWAKLVEVGLDMLNEAGVECLYYDDEGNGLGCEPLRLDYKLWTP